MSTFSRRCKSTSEVDLVNKYLGTSYDVVKTVYDHILSLQSLADKIDDLTVSNTFNQIYYGRSDTPPTTRLNGSPLQEGDLYYDTQLNAILFWNGLTWLTLIGNIDVSMFATAEQGLLADSAVQPNTATTLTDLTVNTLQFTGGTYTQGTLSWNADEETVDIIQNGAVLQVGQEIHYHVKNTSGSTISDGKPVMATGSLGNSGRITIDLMDGTSSSNAKYFLGITTESLDDSTDGKVTMFGKVRGINTTGSLYSQVWNDGDVLWISTTAAGGLTNVEPTTGLKAPVGYVVHAHANGTIFVRATAGHHLHESHDVNLTNPQDNDLLVYNAGNWTNVASSILGGGTSTVSHTLSDGSATGTVTVQEAFEIEQIKVVYGGNY